MATRTKPSTTLAKLFPYATDKDGYLFRRGSLVCDRHSLFSFAGFPSGVKNVETLWDLDPVNIAHLSRAGAIQDLGPEEDIAKVQLSQLIPATFARESLKWRGEMWAGTTFDVLRLLDSSGDFLLHARYRALWEFISAHNEITPGRFEWRTANVEDPKKIHLVNVQTNEWVGSVMLVNDHSFSRQQVNG